jgi:hypothetical protein
VEGLKGRRKNEENSDIGKELSKEIRKLYSQ